MYFLSGYQIQTRSSFSCASLAGQQPGPKSWSRIAAIGEEKDRGAEANKQEEEVAVFD